METMRRDSNENRNARTTPTGKDTEAVQAHAAELKDEMDELLDDIDTVLEENAWVENYRQKGGQ
jgi:ubiquitin-like protein Pup